MIANNLSVFSGGRTLIIEMEPMEDSALLQQYARDGSDDAFAALVTRHINLVYSVAQRHTGSPENAEEITQAVFIILAKKAAQLRHDKALSSWLFQTTRLTAANFVRSESRRRLREQEAHMQSILNEPEEDLWPKLAPLLDSAVANLREKDRQAILLRFYEGKNLREVGAGMGTSEDAADKRVNRALEKLRRFFSKRGVDSATSIIAATISAHSVQSAPTALAKAVTVVASAKGAAAGGSILFLATKTMKTMTWLKMKFAIGVGVASLIAVGAATVATVALSQNGATINPATGLPLGQPAQPGNSTPNTPLPAPPDQVVNDIPPPPASSTDLSATNLVRLSMQAYASLSTYRSAGSTVHWWGDGGWTNQFTEVLNRSKDYNIEAITGPHPFSYTNRWWSDQGTNYMQLRGSIIIPSGDLDGNLSLANQESVSPALFFDLNWGNVLNDLKWSSSADLVRLDDQAIGTNSCYVLKQTNAGVTLWIDQQSLLIRRYERLISPAIAAEALKRSDRKPEDAKPTGFVETYDDIVVNETLPKEAFIPNLGN